MKRIISLLLTLLMVNSLLTVFGNAENSNDYAVDADQIKRMQVLIHEIMDRSASIEADERRNKKIAEAYFSSEREKMATGKRSAAAAFNYYSTMNKFKDIPPQFYDTKN